MLDWAGMPPDHVLGVEPVKGRALTAEKVAINAVLAGCACRPTSRWWPAAVEAICQPELLVHGATASTGGCAILLVVNGPIRRQLQMSSAHSALAGPDRASVCIGRAVRLVLRNLLEVRPGELDRSTLGHPGKLSWCLAEDEEGGAPWLPLAMERGVPADVSAVTAFAASGPRQIMNEWTTDPAELLTTVVAEIKATMLHYSIWAGQLRRRLPTAAPHGLPRRRLVEGRHPPVRLRPCRRAPVRLGGRRQGGRGVRPQP